MSTEWVVCDVDCEYIDNTDSQPITEPEKMEMSVETLLVCAIYGLLFLCLWCYSVMGGVKLNPHVTLMAIPTLGAALVSAIIVTVQAVRKFVAARSFDD